jgi:xanthine dehydrogenase molybdopterin-binding subunit B
LRHLSAPSVRLFRVFHVREFFDPNDAVASVGGHKVMPNLDAPATPERILAACNDVRRRAADA